MPTDNESTKWLYQQLSDRGYNVGKDLSEFDNLMRTNKESREWAFQTARSNGLNVGKDQSEFDSLVAPIATGQPTTSTQAGIAAQQVVDEYDRSVAENSNNTPLSTPEQERQPVQSHESTPRAQFVPEYSNVKGFTVAKDSPLRQQYPFLAQLGEDEQAYFRTDTNEPLYAWKDSEGKDITPDEAATLNQRADIEQNDAIRPRQVPVTSLQLPEEVKSSGIRTDKKVSEYADELLKQQYGDGYWDKIFTDENGNEISGEELRNNLAQETYNALTDDIRKARIALFEAGGDKEAEAEINTGMANKWQGVMSDKRMLETLHDENAMKQDVKDYAQGEIDKAREEERRIIEEMNKRGEELDAASSPYVDQTFNTRQVDNRYTFLTTKLNAVRDRIRSWEAVRDSDDYGAMRALKDTAGNLRSWDLGYSDMIKGMHLVFGTEQDKKELANLLGNAERAKNFEQKAISDFARYVQIGGQSLPFMATFVGSGGGFRTLSEGVAKGAVKWAERKALQGIQKNAVKYLGVAAGDILAGYTLSGTLQGMGTLGDIMQRRAGDIEYNTEKGEYELVNPRGWAESAYKGATASMIDNATELLGDHLNIGKAAMKLLPKAGLKQVSDWLTKAGKSELYTTTREWLKRAGINGLGGEILEEEMAIPMNAVFVGDNPLLFGDGGLLDAKTQKDIVFGVGLSVFAMNAAAVSLHGTGQGINALQTMFDKDQRRLDAADIAAIEIIGGQWTEIKNEIDNATNEELADVAQKIADDKDLNEEQKKAAGEYVTSTLQMRGHNLGENAAMQSNEQRDAYLDSVLSPEERQNVHDDGMIHAAVLYPTAENNGQPQEVFITKGNIVMNADGTINAEASDKEIYYKGADGQAHITSPDKFQSVAQPINVEEYAAANAPQEAQAGYTPGQQVSVNIDGQDIQGEVTNVGEDGNVLVSFENPDGTLSSRWLAREELEQSNGRIAEGQVVNINVDGQTFQATVQGTDGNGNVSVYYQDANGMDRPATFTIDEIRNANRPNNEEPPVGGAGAVVENAEPNGANEPNALQAAEDRMPIDVSEYFGNAEEAMATAKDIIQNGEVIGTLPDGSVQMQKDGFVVTLMPDGNGGMNVTGIERTGNNASQNIPENGNIGAKNIQQTDGISTENGGISAENIQQEQQIPQDDEGNLIYDQVPVETTIADLYDGSLNDEEVQGFIDANIADAQKKYDSVQKKTPKIGTNKAKYLEQKRKWQADVDEAKRVLDYWNEVNSQKQALTHTTEEETQAAQAELSGQNAREEFNQYNENGVNDAVSVASDFIRGAKITPESFRAETGYGTGEQRRFVGMIASEQNGGKSIDRLAEELVSYDNAELNGVTFNGDTSAAKDAILEALQSAGTRGELTTDNTAEQERYVEARRVELDAQCMEAYGMTYEDYLAYEEQNLPEMLRKYANFDEVEFYNLYADEIEQSLNARINEQENDTAGEEPRTGGGNEVLPGEGTDNVRGSEGGTEQGTEVPAGVQGTVEDGAVPEETNRGEDKEYQLSETDTQSEQVKQDNIRTIDPRSMSNDERQQRGDMLRNAPAIEVKAGQIVSTPELSARKVAERWWDENVPEPVFYDTEVGEVEINKNSVESSLAHRYGQAKLDAITSLVDGFENAVYLGTLPDFTRQEGVLSHYFAYPIIYNDKRCYVFCRAMQDANKNRLYVHEVFVAENIKRGDTLQTAASQPHGGIALYKDILGNVLEEAPEQQSLLDGNNPHQYPANRELSESKDTQTSANEQTVGEKIAQEEAKVEQNPTEAQKEAGNYKKGHIKIDGYDVTIENPKGSVRSGVDRNGQEWSVTMNNTYGYIRGTEGVDGDHIDVFLSDDPTQGDVYVIDQVNEDGSFDEHKVMYGFKSALAAKRAYLANYSPGWKGLGIITKVSKEEFKKWINSSHRKTKPFAEYKSVNKEEAQNEPNVPRPIEGEIRFREADNEISDFARKHNLNEKDVQDYADYMRRGNLNGAARAFHEIRRKVRIDNEGTSFGEFVKLFSPVKKELYEKFGNIDDLREQYVQAEMEERNIMEAARKRAEEAAEAERRRLQEFQDMSDEQLDEEYSKAVEANDESRMRDLVNEAARRNGYGDVGSEYQGVGAWSAPSNPGYESDEERRAAVENDAPDVNITDIANGYSQQPSDYFTNLRAYGTDTAHGRESAEAINKAIDEVRNGKDPMVKVYRAVPKSVKEGKLRNGDWVTPSRKYAEMHGDNRLEGDYRIIEQEVPASQLWWDGNDINEWGFDDGKGYAYRNTKNNRKLNDLITRDDKGNIIPLSQRFNARKADVRYRFIGEQGAARLDAAEEATTRLDNLSTARQMEQAYNDKKARIDKLRDSKPVEITGEEYKGKYDLNRDSAQDFILKNLRGEYTIADTGEKVTISKVGAKKVTSHSMGNNAHLKSIFAIPQLLENAIFIEETPNEKSNGKYDSYRYYVVGLKIGNEDYTARITIGVKNGEYYYDHYLTEIEKGNLIEIANGFIPTGDAPVPSYTKSKDTRLISLLQTNDQENARKIKLATGWERGADGKWKYETPDFEYHPNGDARQNDKYKESDWYKELYDLEERLFNGETLTDEETRRFDELAARENEIRDNDKNTEHVYLDDYVKDDELFKAYPELKQTRVDFVDLPNEEYSAKYNSEENRITVNQAKSMDVKSVLAHEIQHVIQRIEGFASGSNTDNYRNAATSENVIAEINAATGGRLVESGGFNNTPEGIFDALNRKTTYGTILRDNSIELDEVARKYGYEAIFDLVNDIGKFKSSVEMYRSEAGEVEARNVQERLNMTPEQRRNMLAEETEDVAREDQQFLQDAIGTGESLASTVQSDDIDAAVADTANKLNIGVRVAHSVDEVSDEGVRRAIEKGRNVKGWYDTRTGEIVVYAPNATDADDAVRTVLHEGVAHYGLRQLVGDENFDTFLDNIYNNVDEGIKAAIDEKAQRHGWSTRVATEEYLASLAEDTNFEAARSSGLWQRIKDFFMDLLTKAGVRLNEALTDNELRYILWRSYENLAEPNGRDIIGTVRDVAMQGRLDVGNYGNEDMRLRETEDEQTPEKKSENKYRELYDKRVSRRRARLNRSYFDSMQPVKVLQKTITEETGQQIRPEENVYLQENRANSMAQRKHEMWERGHMEPARREVTKLMQQIMGGNWLTRRFKLPKTRRNAYNAVVRYMKSKHGLENNEYRRNMEAEAAREPFEAEIGAVEKLVKDGNISRAEADKRQAELKEQADKAETESRAKTLNKDYSGLQGIYGKDFERKAKEYVEDFEGAYDTAPLWREWNGATKAILEEEYKSGLLSKELYDSIRNMYKYYIPLKGWAENRAEDVYTYYATGSGDGGKPHRREGRTSESDDPLVTLEQDADRQFTAAARNRTKQALYNLATAHKSSLLTVRRQWYQNMGTKENPDWQRKDPEIPENATPEQMEQIIKDFEKDMRKLEKEGTAMRQKKPMILPYHPTKSMEKEHTVRVMVNGKEYIIYVNGNPAAAQAVNGTSTPQDPDGSVLKRIYGALRWINRVKASLLTAVNVNFIPGNLVRDAQYSIQNMKAKEPVDYVLKYVKNLGEGMAKMTSARLFYKDKKGTLNMDDKTERLFKEFLDNGGETGYTARYTLEKQRRRNMAAINRMTGIDWLAGLRMLQHSLEYVNRSVETIVRFAAYKTSREAGRSIAQSINDAKEASVNFDKHGSGELGNKEWRLAYIFSNVGFQALRRLLENASGHPVRFTLAQIERFALGFAVPMMAKAMLDAYGDDDEKDAYEALPEWMRESGLAVPVSPILRKVGADDAADKVKRVFLYLPLGPEDKIWYALGENAWHLFNKGEMTVEDEKNMALKFGSLAADLLPLDFQGYGSNPIVSLAPTLVQDFVALKENVNYWGQPIYRESTNYNEHDPGHRLAFTGTPEWYVERAEDINRLTGGDEYTKGWLSPKPEQIEYFINQTGGGVTRVVNQVMSLIERAGEDGNKDIQVLKNVPVVSSLVKKADVQDGKDGFDREKYYDYIDEYEKALHDYNAYRKAKRNGDDEAGQKAEKLKESPTGERMDIIRKDIRKIRNKDKQVRRIDEKENPTAEEEARRDKLKTESNELKQKLLEKLDKVKEKPGKQ